jgi:hypothetical protein
MLLQTHSIQENWKGKAYIQGNYNGFSMYVNYIKKVDTMENNTQYIHKYHNKMWMCIKNLQQSWTKGFQIKSFQMKGYNSLLNFKFFIASNKFTNMVEVK